MDHGGRRRNPMRTKTKEIGQIPSIVNAQKQPGSETSHRFTFPETRKQRPKGPSVLSVCISHTLPSPYPHLPSSISFSLYPHPEQPAKQIRSTMGRIATEYLAMKTGPVTTSLIDSDINDLEFAAKNLVNNATKLGGLGFGTSFLKWVASLAAIYLLILDRTNWRTNMLTSLLIPYIFFSLPSLVFHFLRGEVGKWIAFIAVVLRLFFPRHFPDWLEMPGSLILLLVVAPNLFAHTLRHSLVGVVIDLVIGCYLLQEHIRASGGFRNSLTQRHGISNTLGILLLLVYPLWALVLHFL